MKTIIASILLLVTFNVFAAAPTCQLTSSGSPYCQYNGKVNKIYINNNNLILLYFDTNLNLENAESVGYVPTNLTATAFYVSENPEFAKLFYSTALTAQASNRSVTIQMRGTTSGYLKFDRIWLAE